MDKDKNENKKSENEPNNTKFFSTFSNIGTNNNLEENKKKKMKLIQVQVFLIIKTNLYLIN